MPRHRTVEKEALHGFPDDGTSRLVEEAPIEAGTSDQDIKARLSAEHPGWSIWRSSTGRWYATRRAELTKAERDADHSRTLEAGTPEELTQLIANQESVAPQA
ncbi:hypothetical protein [Streptosporangium sp. NPDC051022]|uniref:hypothetical protein n=1 Tax=Streptosporangium sp. NPDC051022 TaxID=3155752 RepID=UPI00343ABC2E